MPQDPRDVIWNETYYLHYKTYYAEISEERLDARWSTFDHVARIMIAFTSGGSAIAGLALWKDPRFYWIWVTLSMISAVFALLSKQFSVGEKLRDHSSSCNAFSSLRMDLENFMMKMRINPTFPVDAFEERVILLKKRYSEELGRIKHDIFLTENLRNTCQDELESHVRSI